jgi:bifunctional UDP-N-acetylglucosamine pyrophosphorylase/glucosamine-1-phosphate N-acetyltransferase
VHQNVVFLENVRVKKGASIGPFCVIEGTEIGKAQVGPFARIRPKSEIYDNAKVGNFVEIKNSVVSDGTKVNHLSYIGDCNIGKGTNIGAGAITCNYDGFVKYRTIIGANVFVGSNTAMVAPVQIHDNAIIGAGSVITKDVEEGALSIARERQRNIGGWADRFRKK